MANRLPTVGGDSGNWGTVLNNFLQQSHNSDGTLKNVYTVSDYGATGDGSTDDTSALQSALSTGKISILLPGTYKITSALKPISNSGFVAPWGGAKIVRSGNIHVFDLAFAASCDGVVLEGFEIDCQSGVYNNTAFNAINCSANYAITNLRLQELYIHDVGGAGILILSATGLGSNGIVIERNRVKNTGTHGIICQGFIDRTQILDNLVENFSLLYADRPGIMTGRSAKYHVIRGNIVLGGTAFSGTTSAHGISIEGGDYTCSNNYIKGAIGYGIEVGASDRASISGNSIYNCSNAGIVLSADANQPTITQSVDVTIAGNNISGCLSGIYAFVANAVANVGQGTNTVSPQHDGVAIVGNNCGRSTGGATPAQGHGIYLTDTMNFKVGDNNCYANSGCGVLVESTCDSGFVEGNSCVNNNTSADAANGGIHVKVLSTHNPSKLGVCLGFNFAQNNSVNDYQTYVDGGIAGLSAIMSHGCTISGIRAALVLGQASNPAAGYNAFFWSVNTLQFSPDAYTAAQIADKTSAANTTNKSTNRIVIDSTNSRYMRASGSTTTSQWSDFLGTNVVVPV